MAGPDFDSIKHLNPYNVEYWEGRELMPLLGYGNKWQNFVDVIKKAMISCETTGNIVTDHFCVKADQRRAMITCRPTAECLKIELYVTLPFLTRRSSC